MKKQVKKLTMVSVTCKGRRSVGFVNAPMINGKAVVTQDVIDNLLTKIDCNHRGLTYSIGT